MNDLPDWLIKGMNELKELSEMGNMLNKDKQKIDNIPLFANKETAEVYERLIRSKQ